MKTILTLLCSILAFTAFAQNNFVKGYYITAQDDTIATYIDDKNWVKKPTYIRVKSTLESNTVTILSAAAVKEFVLTTGDQFVSEIVQVDKSPVNVNLMKVDAAPEIVTDTVFLRVLVKGKLSLLYMEDEDAKEHFYVQQQNMQPEELLIIRKLVDTGDKQYVSALEVYKEQLARLLHDCPNTAEKAYNAELRATMLSKLITVYNSCFGPSPEVAYTAKTERLKYKFGAVTGLMPTSLYIGNKENPYIVKSAPGTVNYTAGLSLNIILPRAKGKWSVYNELAWKAYQVSGAKEFHISPNAYKREEVHFELSYVGLNTMLRYRFPFKAVQPYLSVGMSNNFSVINNNTAKIYSREFTIEEESEGKYIKETRNYEQAFLAGAGVAYKKLNAEMRYERGNGMSDYFTLRTTRKTLNLLIGYSFN